MKLTYLKCFVSLCTEPHPLAPLRVAGALSEQNRSFNTKVKNVLSC